MISGRLIIAPDSASSIAMPSSVIFQRGPQAAIGGPPESAEMLAPEMKSNPSGDEQQAGDF